MIESFRHELKYVCSDMQIELIKNRLSPLLQRDSHADNEGEYIIRSLYFDDYSNRCFYENENGVDPRYKWRVRIYNCSRNRIALEKKVKKQGMTGKESCLIDEEVFGSMLSGDCCLRYLGKGNDLLNEWIVEKNNTGLIPKVIVQYKRIPMIYKLGNVRITFDSNISGSTSFERFFNKSIASIPILQSGHQVLEVKYDDYFPDLLYNLCDTGHLMQTTFSKFYLCCKAMEGNLYVV